MLGKANRISTQKQGKKASYYSRLSETKNRSNSTISNAGKLLFDSHRYGPNATAFMMRPGTNVNSPAMTSPPVKIEIIVIR